MSVEDLPLMFDCDGEELVGILSMPAAAATRGVIVVVGGPQYRVGSHRQFLQLARCLASAGFPTLRFDYRGMGDSSGTARRFDEVDDDIDAAIAALQGACPDVREVVLWGLCDGASAIAMHARRGDVRVRGVVLVNPWVRDEATYANVRIKHYYGGRLLSGNWWRRLAGGDVKIASSLRGLAATARKALLGTPASRAPATFQARMAAGMRRFEGRMLLMMSGNDLTAREFDEHAARHPEWQQVLARPGTKRCDLLTADHTFSREAWRNEADAATVEWLRSW